MRNNFFYILIFCAFTNTFGKNEEEKPEGKEIAKHTREFYEKEAKKDLESLLSSLRFRSLSKEDKDDAKPLNANGTSNKIMERIDEVVSEPKTKKHEKSSLRTNDYLNANIFKRAHMQNLPLNLRNTIQSSSKAYHPYVDNDQFQQPMNRHNSASNGFFKPRISGGKNANHLLRNHVNQVNVKPEVYPLSISADEYGSTEMTSKDALLREQYNSNEDELTEFINEIDTKHKNETTIRAASKSEKFDLNELFSQLHNTHAQAYPDRKESDNNVFVNDFLNKLYSRTNNRLRIGNRLENAHLDKVQDIMDSKNIDSSKTVVLRTDIFDRDISETNEPLDEFMKYLEIGKALKASHNTLSHSKISQSVFQRQAKQDGFRSRRSTNTQAGYTQDPDTCKTYNENLVKLWSNLSKLINVTDQPNEKALHNIAMMIQAYLEHQNAKQPEIHNKIRHEGPKDKISEVMLRIRKVLDESEASAEKITKIIIKYLRPEYADVQSEDCQDVNEETLGLSVDLLYKNYVENNAECNGDDEGIARNNKMSLRKQTVKSGKYLSSNGHSTVPLANSDIKPEIQTILIENELYNDYHKGKFSRHKPRNRRVMRSRKHRSRSEINRSGNRHEHKIQSKASRKSPLKKQKKSSRKSHSVPGSCEKYATRKLIVSLRSVMERFMGLLECQLDKTLRSVNFDRVSKNPYYLYASKFYSNEDNRRHRKILPRLSAKNIGRKMDKSHKTERRDTSVENEQDGLVRNDATDSAWVRKYSFDKIKGIDSVSPAVIRDTGERKSDTENKKQQQHGNNDYITTYSEYFQSPPLYDDYDGIYKTHKVTNLNGFPSLINPLISLNDKKNTGDRSADLKLASFNKERDNEKSNEYDSYSASNSEEPLEVFNVDQQTEANLMIEQPFIDFTKLRKDDLLIEEKSKSHIQNFESITEFLKKARDASLQTPEFAIPFALDTNKGYVELTHLIKYPKILIYRPQFLVKNTMPYDDFLKTINNINMTNDEVRLMKIVRHLPDSSVQVLFETEDFEAPLEVRNLNDNRRSGSPDPVGTYQFGSRIDTASNNINADITHEDSKDLVSINRNGAHRQNMAALVKSDSSISADYVSPELKFNQASGILRGIDELSPNSYNDFNSATNLTSNSSESSLYSGFTSGLMANIPGFDSVKKGVGSAISSKLESGMDVGLDTALNLGLKLSPLHPQLGSFFSKLFPSSHSNSQSVSNQSLSSESHKDSYTDSSPSSLSSNSHADSLPTNSNSHSLVPYSDSSDTEVENSFPPSTPSIVLRWWRFWRDTIKRKMKEIIGKMASLTDNINQIDKL